MPLFLQGFNSPQEAHWAAADLNLPGKLGTIYETSSYGGQLLKLVDAGAVAGDAVYHKTYAGVYDVTPTVGNSSAYEFAGWITATVAQNEYCFVQKKGLISAKANGVFADGMPVWPDSGNNRITPAGVFSGSLAATGVVAGDLMNVTNPCTGAWLVTSLFLTTTTKSTGASTADFGVAANGTTSNDGLIDGIDLGTATVTNANNFGNSGTNGKASQVGAAGTVLTGSEASDDTTGLVGTYSGTFRPIGFNNLPVVGIAQGTISGGKVSVFANLPYLMRQQNQ